MKPLCKIFIFTFLLGILFCKPPELKNSCDPFAVSIQDQVVSDSILQAFQNSNPVLLQLAFPDKIKTCGSAGPYTLSGTVKGLSSQSIVISSGTTTSESLTIDSGATAFSFSQKFPRGTSYNVTVSKHSKGLCYVSNGSGSFLRDVSNISIVCVEPLSYSGISSWFRADSLGLGDGAIVTSWSDESSNGNILNGSSASYSSTAINGQPAVELNNTSLATSTGTGLGGNSFTFHLVFKRSSPPTGSEEYIFFFGNNNVACPSGSIALSIQAGGAGLIGLQTPCGAYLIAPSSVLEIAVGDNTPKLLNLRYSYSPGSSNLTAILNGVTLISGGASDIVYNNLQQYFQFGSYPGGSRPFSGAIAEFIYYNRALSNSELTEIDCYLAKKYSFSHNSSCQ